MQALNDPIHSIQLEAICMIEYNYPKTCHRCQGGDLVHRDMRELWRNRVMRCYNLS